MASQQTLLTEDSQPNDAVEDLELQDLPVVSVPKASSLYKKPKQGNSVLFPVLKLVTLMCSIIFCMALAFAVGATISWFVSSSVSKVTLRQGSWSNTAGEDLSNQYTTYEVMQRTQSYVLEMAMVPKARALRITVPGAVDSVRDSDLIPTGFKYTFLDSSGKPASTFSESFTGENGFGGYVGSTPYRLSWRITNEQTKTGATIVPAAVPVDENLSYNTYPTLVEYSDESIAIIQPRRKGGENVDAIFTSQHYLSTGSPDSEAIFGSTADSINAAITSIEAKRSTTDDSTEDGNPIQCYSTCAQQTLTSITPIPTTGDVTAEFVARLGRANNCHSCFLAIASEAHVEA